MLKKNTAKNLIEYKLGEIKLDSLPRMVTIGVSSKCNAMCFFCLAEKHFSNLPPFTLDLYKNFYEVKLSDALRAAEHVYFVASGEVLLMDGLTDFLDYINDSPLLERTIRTIVTNGIALTPEVSDRFDSRYELQISIHASNAELHEKVTGTKAFGKVLDNLSHVAARKGNRPFLCARFDMNMMNVDDIPKFVKLMYSMDVNQVTLDYMVAYRRNHLPYICSNDPARTREKILEAKEFAQSHHFSLVVPPIMFGDTRDFAKRCTYPWDWVYADTNRVSACCHTGVSMGNLNEKTFCEIWNGLEYQELRKALVDRQDNFMCTFCLFNHPVNVNNVDAHVTFRPELRGEMSL